MSETIRRLAEDQLKRHQLENVGSDSHLCIWGCGDWPCWDHDTASAIIKELNAGLLIGRCDDDGQEIPSRKDRLVRDE